MSDTIDLDTPDIWPSDLLSYLESNHDTFLGWESDSPLRSAKMWDQAIYGLEEILDRYALVGWHCTRLTEQEVNNIRSSGMELPNLDMLKRRIDVVVSAGLLTAHVAKKLKATNQADEDNRAGRIWFCFYHPRLAGEGGIIDFFRYWGGEALYNSHDRNPTSGAAICRIGSPCIVEAMVPIANLGRRAFLPVRVVRIYLISRGYKTAEDIRNEGASYAPIPAENIRDIIQFPSEKFLHLTGCSDWRQRLF